LKALHVALLVSMATTLARGALAQSSKVTAQPMTWPNEPAGPAPTFRHRALLGVAVGNVGSAIEEDSSSAPNIGLDFALEERFTRLFSLAARGRISSWNYGWEYKLGYMRTRWDFGLDPRLWIRPVVPRPGRSNFFPRRVEGYAGVGAGVTLPSLTPPPRRAYDERIDGSPGYYISACLGGTLGNRRAALFMELGYAFHSTNAVATIEPRAPGVPRTVEERNYADHSLLFSIGIVAGFGVLE
jgi:hypothetical protein